MSKTKINKSFNRILLVFLIILSLPQVTGEVTSDSDIPVYIQNREVVISHAIRDGSVNPNPSINASLTLKDPLNNVVLYGNMSYNINTLQHNITIPVTNTSQLGIYNYEITANNGTDSETTSFKFEISLIGKRASTSQSVSYLIVAFASIFFFILSFYGAITIPFKNKTNNRNQIIGLNELKYIKILLWFVTYLFLIFIMFSFYNISGISNWELGHRWFYGTFWLLIVFLAPSFVLLITFAFVNFFKDRKLDEMLRRNLTIR
jgi:hypothetical protein